MKIDLEMEIDLEIEIILEETGIGEIIDIEKTKEIIEMEIEIIEEEMGIEIPGKETGIIQDLEIIREEVLEEEDIKVPYK